MMCVRGFAVRLTRCLLLGCGLFWALADLSGTAQADDKQAADKSTDKEKELAKAKEEYGFEFSEAELTLLKLTNKERQNQGLPPLKPNEKLFKAARGHSAAMARVGRIGHVLEGKGPGERLAEVSYQSSGWGENCAAGQESPAEAVRCWMMSPGHRSNLLGREYFEIGLGIAPDGQGGFYWTQIFATPRNR